MSTTRPPIEPQGIPPRRRVWPVGIRALAHRNYRLFFSGQLLSVIGTWMQTTAQSWLVYRLTGSELLLGLAGFADKVPIFLFGILGGAAADRYDRHRLVIVTQAAAMVQALALGVLVVGGWATVWHIFALAAILGLVSAFDVPARQSLISAMVVQDDLPNALALNSSIFNAARVVGPAVAGVMVATTGEGVCFLINAASYMAVIVCLVRMRFPQASRPLSPSLRDHLGRGIRYALRTPPVLCLLLLLGLVSLCGAPYVVLMPIFVAEVIGGGARELGALMGSSGVGAFLAAAALARRRSVRGLGRVVAGAAVGFGVGLVILSATSHLLIAAGVLVGVGFCMITQAAATNLLLQSLCPDPLRGRVISLYAIILMGMSPWGSLLAGALAHSVGTTATLLYGGLLCAAAGLAFAAAVPALRAQVLYPIPESRLPHGEPAPAEAPRVDSPGAGV